MRKINGFYDEKKDPKAGDIVKGVLEHDGRLSKYSSGEERTEEYQRFAEEYANLQKTRDGRNF